MKTGLLLSSLLALLTLPPASGCRPAEEAGPTPQSLPTTTTSTGAEMVLVPAGTFLMGGNEGKADEAPQHEVALDAFFMDRTEVTQEQFEKLAKLEIGRPSHFKGPDRPVEQISWANAALYCNLRSKAEGLEPCYDESGKCNFRANGYRLPTEAEWEYACRACSSEAYGFGSDPRSLGRYAWCKENALKKTQPVARKEPNAWGLFDMHGNVAEWCNDVYDARYYAHSPGSNPTGPAEAPAEGERRVLRGGAWDSGPDACRSSARIGQDPGFQDACFARDAIGFRCVRRASKVTTGKEPLKTNRGPEKTTRAEGAGNALPAGAIGSLAALIIGSAQDGNSGKTGLVYGDVYRRHKTREGHPERPERLSAQGTKVNVPLPAGSGDREYRRAFDEQLKPAAVKFRPNLVLISAGFDAHANDLLGRMKVSTRGFAELTRIARQIAQECCRERLVSVLEGGYNPEMLAESVEAHLRALQGPLP